MMMIRKNIHNSPFYHTIEDILKEEFPVDVYNDELFSKICIGPDNINTEIQTYCHYKPRVGTKTIKRIENNTYGYCEITGKPIGLKRLEARPIATLSIEAQEMHENEEQINRN